MSDFHRGTRRFDDVESESISTGALTDADDGQPFETLREAGYETGDFVSVPVFRRQNFLDASTTSTTFGRTPDVAMFNPTFFPASGQTHAALAARAITTGGDPIEVRVRVGEDLAGNDSITFLTTEVSTDTAIATPFEPISLPDAPRIITVQFRNSGSGTDSVILRGETVFFGVEL